MKKENNAVEISRSNITLARFLSTINRICKSKGDVFGFELSVEDFKNLGPSNERYFTVDGKIKYTSEGFTVTKDIDDVACKSEICKMKPLEYQCYFLNHDGTYFNEICEFTFDDNKKGSGYYFKAEGVISKP